MGDPTLRCYVTAAPTHFQGVVDDCPSGQKDVHFTWSASAAAEGYHVYPGTDIESALAATDLEFGPEFVNEPQWTDHCPVPSGSHVYAVRAVRFITTGAESFKDLSPAVSETISVP